jgi:hypothetical protein
MANEYRSQQAIVDELFRLSDAVTITATARAQVDGSDQILDFGAGCTAAQWTAQPVRVDLAAIIDITALTLGSDDIFYFVFEGSNNADMTSAQCLGCIIIGHATPAPGQIATSATGRREMRVVNVQDDICYRYGSLNVTSAGSTESATYSAYAVPQSNH